MLKKISIALLSGLSPALAQNFLEPLFVTAARSAQSENTAPYTISRLDADFLRENTRRTLPDALQYTPGVLVQKTAHGHGSPFIRGFTGRQNLLLVDGVRVNNSTFRGGPVQYWNTVDPLGIDHIELIKSQGSVLYGSDAVGGTVNTLTKSSRFRDETADQPYLGGSAYYEYRSNGEGSNIGRLETETGIGGKFGIMLGLSAKDYGDIADSAVGRMKNTGYPEQDLDLRGDWAVSPDSTLTLAHFYVNQDGISRWHRTLDNPGWNHDGHLAAPGKYTENTFDQERSMTYLRYAGENPQANAAIKRWSGTLSFQKSAESEFQNRFPDSLATNSGVLRGSAIDADSTGIDLVLESPAGPGALVYGFDFYHDAVDSSGYKSNLLGGPRAESLPVADDSQYDLFGAYAQYLWKPVERLEITSGARYTYAEATLGRFYNTANIIQPTQSEDWDALVGSLRGLYRLSDSWNLYGGISQAFRAPNLDDLSGNLTAKSATAALGSADVSPEEYITYEIGTRHHTDSTSLNLAVFYTDAQGLISGVPITSGSTTTAATNDGDGYVYGVELEGAWKLTDAWTLSGFTAWQDGRTTTSTFLGGPQIDKPNTRLLPLSGSVALRWNDSSGKFWAEGRLLAAAKEDRITAADQAADAQRIPTGGTPAHLVTSLHAGWHFDDHLDLTCGLENLTDEDYRNHGSGQNEPGLNGILGVKATW